jgi:hypothetical protein
MSPLFSVTPQQFGLGRDRQCTYNLALRRVCTTTVAVEKQYVLHILSVCVCSLRYPEYNAQRCHLWPVRLYKIFPHYLTKGTIFEKRFTEYKTCVFFFKIYIGLHVTYPKVILIRF